VAQIAQVLRRVEGATRKDAERLAMSLLAGLAGARGLARVYRSPEPFEAVAHGIVESIRALSAARRSSRGSGSHRRTHPHKV
jgi:hypothetical protein